MSCGSSSAGSPKSVTCHLGKGPEGGSGLVTAASIHYLHLPAHYLHQLTHTGRGRIVQCRTIVLSQINSFRIVGSLRCHCISIFPKIVFVDVPLQPT